MVDFTPVLKSHGYDSVPGGSACGSMNPAGPKKAHPAVPLNRARQPLWASPEVNAGREEKSYAWLSWSASALVSLLLRWFEDDMAAAAAAATAGAAPAPGAASAPPLVV